MTLLREVGLNRSTISFPQPTRRQESSYMAQSLTLRLMRRVGNMTRNRFLPMPAIPDLAYIEERLQYLLNEVSDLRIQLRELTAPQAGKEPEQDQTKDSFSYQWAEITT